MIHYIIKDKPTRLFLILGGFFIANTILAEVIGVKLFSLEKTLHMQSANLTLFGESGLGFTLTVGVLIWPVVFIMTDLINEYYGVKGVRFLSILTSIIIMFAFLVFYGAIHLAPDDFWINSQKENGVPNMQSAFSQVLGQGMNIIFASLTAFLIGQLADATVFKQIKKITGEKGIWMRATVSTLISQLIDTICVSYIYLYFSLGFSFPRVTAIALTGYIYKFSVAIICTPIIYLIHHLIEEYLGKSKAAEMKRSAMQN
ncbi:MAG: VUT family protein [Chitinophagia bacterium]|jgi:queuosine precursor transporter|nr:VUT family protein [Chitinophagia bacterium]